MSYRVAVYKIFIPQFLCGISLTTIELPQRINNSSSTIAKPDRRGLALPRCSTLDGACTQRYARFHITLPNFVFGENRHAHSHLCRQWTGHVTLTISAASVGKCAKLPLRPTLSRILPSYDPFNSSYSPTNADRDYRDRWQFSKPSSDFQIGSEFMTLICCQYGKMGSWSENRSFIFDGIYLKNRKIYGIYCL